MRQLERNIVYGAKPTQTWLVLSEFKLHARITTTAEDAMLTERLQMASNHIEDLTGKIFAPQTVDIYFDRWPAADYGKPRNLYLGVAPVQSVTSVTYEQVNTGLTQTLVEGTDFYTSLKRSDPYIVNAVMTGQGTWPDYDLAYHKPDVIHVQVQAGFANQNLIPLKLKLAAYMLCTLWYQCREGVNPNIDFKDVPGYASFLGLLRSETRSAI